MGIHTGHPEKYIEIEDRIGELIYDYQMNDLSLEEIEAIRQRHLWVPISHQQSFTSFET